MPSLMTDLASAITHATGHAFSPRQPRAIGGGCINNAFELQDGVRRFFVKTNRAAAHAMFSAESEGLRALAAGIRVPQPLANGISSDTAWLILEYLDLRHSPNTEQMGEALAQLHRLSAPHFGWHIDNTIGSTPQSNREHSDWPTFWREERLRPQLALARQQGCHFGEQAEHLLAQLDDFFVGYTPQPSLLHGDLWGGNAASLSDGTPVIFDPACYYGDRECDLAMTELFGGFGSCFMAAYHATWPVDAGFSMRRTLYNLYHILNHVNLFGRSYESQARQMISQLLAEIRG